MIIIALVYLLGITIQVKKKELMPYINDSMMGIVSQE